MAELAGGVAGQINNLKSILYTFYISGSYGLSDPINIAREVVSNINSNNEIRAFFGLYNCEGVRLVYGYLYNGSLYGSIFIAQFSAEVIRVDINNGEYTKV